MGLDRLRSGGAVRSGAAQDHARQGIAEHAGRRAHQQVDRWLRASYAVPPKTDVVIGDLDVAIGRHDIDRPRLEEVVSGSRLDRKRRPGRQDVAKPAGAVRIEMLRDDDGHRKAGRQCPDHRLERVDAAGRRADHDQARCGLMLRALLLFPVPCVHPRPAR